MDIIEQSLNYVYLKDDDANPGAISLKSESSFDRKENIVINIPGRFQRISIYENELIVCEEIIPNQHIFRFNRPYTEVEPGILFFE